MTRLIRVELLKLRTTRLTYGLAIVFCAVAARTTVEHDVA